MSIPTGITPVFGAASFGKEPGRPFNDRDAIANLLNLLKEQGIKNIDTAQIYGQGWSEEVLGECEAGKTFTIDTKAYGGIQEGSATEEGIVTKGLESLEKLGVSKVDIFYMHSFPKEPMSQYLAGINTLYTTHHAFSRFGLSNYTAQQVQDVHDYCKQHNYILPTVYQGNYNPVARKYETVLFPTLRKLGMAFYAYSPIAGGFLTKTKQEVVDGKGRFDPNTAVGKMYRELYAKPKYLDALVDWEAAARVEGCTEAQLAYRWVAHNSALSSEFGDAIIIGASRPEQVVQTMEGLRMGRIGEEALGMIEEVWEKVREEAPLDNVNR